MWRYGQIFTESESVASQTLVSLLNFQQLLNTVDCVLPHGQVRVGTPPDQLSQDLAEVVEIARRLKPNVLWAERVVGQTAI